MFYRGNRKLHIFFEILLILPAEKRVFHHICMQIDNQNCFSMMMHLVDFIKGVFFTGSHDNEF